ncbi:MAG: hypothetical protein ACO20L_10185 [Candidatus Puniceispirillaceae bacterium]
MEKTMALGFTETSSSGGGDFLPIMKFSAKDGSFVRQDRHQGADGHWEKSETEMDLPFKVVMDMDAIEGGVIAFTTTGPDFRFVKVGEPMPIKPSDEHKEGFRIRMYNKEIGLREMSSSSKIVRNQMNDLHDAYLAGKADNPGKVPVIEITGSDRIQIETKAQGTQTFRSPKWSIAGWVDRPAGLDKAEPAPEPAAVAAPVAATPSVIEGADLF